MEPRITTVGGGPGGPWGLKGEALELPQGKEWGVQEVSETQAYWRKGPRYGGRGGGGLVGKRTWGKQRVRRTTRRFRESVKE